MTRSRRWRARRTRRREWLGLCSCCRDPFSSPAPARRSHTTGPRFAASRGLSLSGLRRAAPRLAAPMTVRHFLTGAELSAAELDALLDRALELKAAPLPSRALQ